MKTTRFNAEDLQRATERSQQKRWAACRDALTVQAKSIVDGGLEVPAFDSSWYDPAVPYYQTYTEFHAYIFACRPLFAKLSELLHAGIVLQNDDWRRKALEVTLGCAEAIDFNVTHFDSGMEYGGIARAMCDVSLGAADLMQGDEADRLHARCRAVADGILRCSKVWRETELKRMAFNNHRVCHMADLLALGYVLGDESLVNPAFDEHDERGFLNLLDGAIYDDGICYESSLKYHYATANFLYRAAQVQCALFPERTDFFHVKGAYGRSLKNYAIGPMATSFRELELPRVGDAYGASMKLGGNPIFFMAYARYDIPICGMLAGECEENNPLIALVLGPEEPIEAAVPEATSRIFPEHGYALLRDDESVHKQVFLTGDRSGIHHQRDSLQLQVELGDEIVLTSTDIKPTALHGFSDTVHERINRWPHAHCQLTVDDLDQKTHASPIPIREWEPAAAIKRVAMVDEHADLQDGVHQGRFVSMRGDWICDCVIAAATRERTWRLFYHLPLGAPSVDEHSAKQSDSALQSDLIEALPDQDPWRAIKPLGGSAPAMRHQWTSGKACLSVLSDREMTLQKFCVPEHQDQRAGLWAKQTGDYAVFVTLITPNAGLVIDRLTVKQLGNELVARWYVGADRLQARILMPKA